MLLAEHFLPESLSKSFFRVFLVRMRENMDQKKLRIWTLFTEYNLALPINETEEGWQKP